MERLTNQMGIPLSMALWLSVEEYDSVADTDYRSATDLLKPTRRLVLETRLEASTAMSVDVSKLARSRIGTAIHNSIETGWTNPDFRASALQRLGIPQHIQDRIIINPEPAELTPDCLPVYLEQRVVREINGYKLGGKYDLVTDGILSDTKTTTVWSYMSGANDWKNRMQGSIYRWLNPEIITKDYMYINYVLLDWKAHEYQSKKDQGYPYNDVLPYRLDLLSLPETEVYIRDKLQALTDLHDTPEPELPPCTPAELWQDRPTYKYYKNPAKMTRSTKNFQTQAEANIRWIEDGQVGLVRENPGTCKACYYCPAYGICTQKDLLISQGLLQPR